MQMQTLCLKLYAHIFICLLACFNYIYTYIHASLYTYIYISPLRGILFHASHFSLILYCFLIAFCMLFHYFISSQGQILSSLFFEL